MRKGREIEGFTGFGRCSFHSTFGKASSCSDKLIFRFFSALSTFAKDIAIEAGFSRMLVMI